MSVEENFFFSFLRGVVTGNFRLFLHPSVLCDYLAVCSAMMLSSVGTPQVFLHSHTHTLMQSATMMCREGRKSDFTEWALVDRANDLP